MIRRLALLLAGAALTAMTVPIAANATLATYPPGTAAPFGTSITATGKDITLNSNLLGAITCQSLNWNGEVAGNSGGFVRLASPFPQVPTQSGCSAGTKSVSVTSIWIHELSSSFSGTGTLEFDEEVDIGSLKCSFHGVFVPFTFTSGTNVGKFSSAGPISGSPAVCGSAKLTGEFAFEGFATLTRVTLD
jgi:hypothetical protein